MKTLTKNISAILRNMSFFLIFLMGINTPQAEENASAKREARMTIDKTSYIIEEAYEITDYFYYYSPYNYLSKAVYYNRHAMRLYNRRVYSEAIRYSLRAREYALMVIDGCDDYWEYFYYTFFGWSRYYGYNPYYTHAYGSGYMYGYDNGYNRGYGRGYDHGYGDGYRDGYMDSRYVEYYNYYSNNGGGNRNNGHAYRQRNPNATVSSNGINAGSRVSAATRIEETGRPIFNKINTSQYFDASEKAVLQTVVDAEVMERSVRSSEPGITFDDQNLSKNQKAVSAIRQSANKFGSNNRATATRVEMAKPETIRPESAIKPSAQNKYQRVDANTVSDEVITRRVDRSKVISTAPSKRLQRIDSPVKAESNKEPAIRIGRLSDDKNTPVERRSVLERNPQKNNATRLENRHRELPSEKKESVTKPKEAFRNTSVNRTPRSDSKRVNTNSSSRSERARVGTLNDSRTKKNNADKGKEPARLEKRSHKATRK